MNERSYEALLYKITAAVTARIAEMNGWSEDEAIEKFVSSELYSYLEKEETKIWQYSSAMLAELFSDEQSGRLSFPEV